MDPFTAAMNALAALMNFLCTPAGQSMATRHEALMAGILEKLHVRIGPTEAASPVFVPPKTA